MAPRPATATPLHEPPSGFERHGERRRRQLIEVAAEIIEEEGIEAVRLPRVAERAGCARTLGYRYFPRREDLLLAVQTELYTRVEGHLEGIRGLAGTARSADPEAVHAMLRSIWDVVTARGLAGLILHNARRLEAPPDAPEDLAVQRFEDRWLRPFRQLGLSHAEASVLARSSAHILMELVLQWRGGEIEADEAVEIWRRAVTGQARAFLEDDSRA